MCTLAAVRIAIVMLVASLLLEEVSGLHIRVQISYSALAAYFSNSPGGVKIYRF